MKKVLFVATVVQKHINVFHLPYLKMFKDLGYQTFVAAANDTDDHDLKIQYCDEYVDINFERNPWHAKNFSAYRKLKKLIDSHEFDIIHCHTPVGGVLCRLAARKARKKGTKVLYTAHGFHFYKGAPLKNWLLYYPVEKFCSYFTDVLITINHEDYALAKKKMKAKRIEYVPGVGIDLSRFENVQVDRNAKRREIGVPKDAFLLISVGELSVRKNHKVIIEAIAKIANNNIHYIIAGQGDLLSELQSLAKEKGIADHVHFLGYRKDIAELYKCADICCFPSIHEGLPVALMEAMACGLPCVASSIRGNTDLINDENGCLIDTDDVDGYIECIQKCILNSDWANNLGQHNIERAQNYDVCNVIKIMKSIYYDSNFL